MLSAIVMLPDILFCIYSLLMDHTVAMTAGTAVTLRSAWAAEVTDPRLADILAKTIGIDTHNHIDVPLTEAEMPGPDIDLKGEMKESGLSAICMTFATDYRPGDTYDRFLKGWRRWIGNCSATA